MAKFLSERKNYFSFFNAEYMPWIFFYYLLKNIIKLKDMEIILFTSLDMHVSRLTDST